MIRSKSDSMASILATDTPELFTAAVVQAAALLREGQVVAVPTETVYGLAANAFNATAVARIFEVKGRPSHNPIIVHVSGTDMARQCVMDWPETARELARHFWPGPLTMVLPRSAIVPDIVTAGGPTVGIRWPQHPFMQAVIQACGFPLAAPSANPSNRISPTNARHVAESLGRRIPLIVDGGASEVGIESTVVDLTSGRPKILRPGMISASEIMACVSTKEPASLAREPDRATSHLKSPGMLKKHYSPKSKMVLCRWRDEEDLRRRVVALGVHPDRVHILAYERIPTDPKWASVHRLPGDPKNYARRFYAALHAVDLPETQLILVEAVPDDETWSAVADRLRRAAAQEGGSVLT